MNIGVFLEDAAALTGITLAAAGMGLASYMHMPFFDAMGTIGVGTMLGALAGFLVKRNLDILTLKSAPADRTQVSFTVLGCVFGAGWSERAIDKPGVPV